MTNKSDSFFKVALNPKDTKTKENTRAKNIFSFNPKSKDNNNQQTSSLNNNNNAVNNEITETTENPHGNIFIAESLEMKRQMFYLKFYALLNYYPSLQLHEIKRELDKIAPLFREGEFIPKRKGVAYFSKKYDVKKVIILQRAVRKLLTKKRKEKKLKYAIAEVIETEKTYGKHLDLLRKKFKIPMSQKVSKEHIDTIFGNLEELIDLNRNFTIDLEKTNLNISKTFMTHLAVMRNVFTKYAVNAQSSLDFLKSFPKKLRPLLMKIHMDPELNQLHLEDFLINPVKRVPLYILMLRNILSALTQKDHDYFALINCIQLLERVASEIDQKKIESDAQKKLENLAERLEFQYLLPTLDKFPRIFLKEGSLIHQTIEKKIHQFYYVFTDMIVCESAYRFHGFIYLQDATVKSIEDTPNSKYGFQIIKKQRKFNLFAGNQQEKESWLTCLKTQTLIRDSLLKDEIKEIDNPQKSQQIKSGILNKQLLTGEWQACFFVLEKKHKNQNNNGKESAVLNFYKIHKKNLEQSLIPKSINLDQFFITRGPQGILPSFQIHLVNEHPDRISHALAASNEKELKSWMDFLTPYCLEVP